MAYPQNGDRIVAIDFVTLLHPMYRQLNGASLTVYSKGIYEIFVIKSEPFRS